LTSAGIPAVNAAARPVRGGRRLPLSWLGAVPFFAYVGVFLLLPTVIIGVGSFAAKDGSLTISNFTSINQPFLVKSFVNGAAVSVVSALAGGLAGALLAYAVATGNPRGLLRRAVTSASGVLAQFGGVTLAFAFFATLSTTGFVTILLQQHGINIFPNGKVWLYELSGLTLLYTYFQIPLMVLVLSLIHI